VAGLETSGIACLRVRVQELLAKFACLYHATSRASEAFGHLIAGFVYRWHIKLTQV
jgi:hypothetical protein